jgi:hypothetical protein
MILIKEAKHELGCQNLKRKAIIQNAMKVAVTFLNQTKHYEEMESPRSVLGPADGELESTLSVMGSDSNT